MVAKLPFWFNILGVEVNPLIANVLGPFKLILLLVESPAQTWQPIEVNLPNPLLLVLLIS